MLQRPAPGCTCNAVLCSFHAVLCIITWRVVLATRPLHDTVLKRYRVAAGSARPLRDYHLMHDSSFIHDYRLPRDPSYSTILPSFTTTSALAIPLWISLPESPPATTIPLWISLPESPPAHTSRPELSHACRRRGSPHGAAWSRAVGPFEPQSDSVPIRRVGAATMVSRPPIFP